MKNYFLSALFVFFLLAFLPLSALLINKASEEDKTILSYTVSDKDNNEKEQTVRVLQVSSGNVLSMNITEYLIGAVASEMPASFSNEALKAQAVACYTYLKWIMANADNAPNEFSDISDDSTAHQGFLTKEQMKERWGSKFDTYYNKIKLAVQSVEKEYISYENEPVLALFHGLSAGYTADSKDILEQSLPYIVSVEAPGDKLSSDFISENSFSQEEFTAIITKHGISTEKNSKQKIKITSASDTGYVTEVRIGDKTLSGTDIRSIFSLKSTNFTVESDGSEIKFTVYGKGHGLGMSQNSADFMARQGYGYKEILAHFYPGTKITSE